MLSQFLVPERIEEYRGFGGVRIEDDLIVTDTGMECFTVVPRRSGRVVVERGRGRAMTYCLAFIWWRWDWLRVRLLGVAFRHIRGHGIFAMAVCQLELQERVVFKLIYCLCLGGE